MVKFVSKIGRNFYNRQRLDNDHHLDVRLEESPRRRHGRAQRDPRFDHLQRRLHMLTWIRV